MSEPRVEYLPARQTGVGFGHASFFREPAEQARQHFDYVLSDRQVVSARFAPARAVCKHFVVSFDHANRDGGDRNGKVQQVIGAFRNV